MKKCSEIPTRTKKPKDNLVIEYPIDPIVISFD
jgi:hypothetical protein